MNKRLSFSIVLRTCDKISAKYPCSSELLENKRLHLDDAIGYAKNNNAELHVICDTLNDTFFDFVKNTVGTNGTVIRSRENSNEGSWRLQFEFAKNLDSDFIEIAEDDYLKFGTLDFSGLDKNAFYTAYDHPGTHRPAWKFLSGLVNTEFSTVFSFIAHKDLLVKYSENFMEFGKKTDAEVWRSITTPWYLELLFNIRNGKLFCSFGPKNKLKKITCVKWVHLANDALPLEFQHLNVLSFDEICEIRHREYD